MCSTPKPNRSWPSAEAPLAARIRACTRCPALVRCRNAPAPGAGPEDARLMIVGMAPGRLGADRTGVPFLGDRSGSRLRGALGSALAGVYITNAVKCAPKTCRWMKEASCRPSRHEITGGRCRVDGVACRPRNRDPVPEEVRNCAPYLSEEVTVVRPVGILALGRLAEAAVDMALGLVPSRRPPGRPTGFRPFVVYLPHPASLHYHPEWDRTFDGWLSEISVMAGVTPAPGHPFYQVEPERG